jgi:hypothetical protein
MALRLKTNIVSFKNRLKTRVALIELLDLSGIAVGNVGVPTCLIKYTSLRTKFLIPETCNKPSQAISIIRIYIIEAFGGERAL